MEWPTIEVLSLSDEDRYNFYNGTGAEHEAPFVNSPSSQQEQEDLIAAMTTVLITKEIYARAATAAISNITVDHESSGLKRRVQLFLEHLRKDNDDHWAREYRSIAREFTELMVEARPRSRTLEICRGGLEAVHDLLKYRLPKDKTESSSGGDTVLAARDAFVLCQSFDKLKTNTLTGVKPPDIDYRYPLRTTTTNTMATTITATTNSNNNNNNTTGTPQPLPTVSKNNTSATTDASSNPNPQQHKSNPHAPPASTTINAAENEGQSLFGFDACRYLTGLRDDGRLETSAASLASHTMVNRDLVAQLAHKVFVILGCDHPLAPTKSLLTIPGLTILGIPSCQKGLDDLRIYTTYNAPDDTTFAYPTLPNQHKYDRGGTDNLVLTRGPHVAQWILEQTEELLFDDDNNNRHPDTELVLVPMPLPARTTTTAGTTTTTTAAAAAAATQPATDKAQSFSTESTIRWVAASDLIVQRVLRARSDDTKCSVWSYQSSTTCMVVPSASTTKSTELLKNRPLHEQLLHRLSLGTALTPTVDESILEESSSEAEQSPLPPTNNHDYAIVNGIVTAEGPHHVLSEHIRLWRAMVTHYPDEYHSYDDEYDDDSEYDDDDDDQQHKVHVFAPYVPLTSPDLIAGGEAHLLEPLRVFGASEAASLMAAVALAGVSDPIVNRPMPLLEMVCERNGKPVLDDTTTPFAMFWNGSFHGGIWNCPYTLDSASGKVGYVLGKVYEYYHYYYFGSGNGTATTEASGDANSHKSSSSPAKATSQQATEAADDTDWILDVVPTLVGINRRGLQLDDLEDDPNIKDNNDDDDDDLPEIVQQRLEMMV